MAERWRKLARAPAIRNNFYATIICFIIKFRYNARSDWLKECALSEYRARSVEGGPIPVFASAFDEFDPKISVLLGSNKRKEIELFVVNYKYC